METMTQKDKERLLRDLCARLPYGVVIHFDEKTDQDDERLYGMRENGGKLLINDAFYIEEIKPYLFPLSSMTEEQKKYINDRWGVNENFDFEIDPNWGKYFVDLSDAVGFINWCYENHLDINGLIPRGLAEDATDKNIY